MSLLIPPAVVCIAFYIASTSEEEMVKIFAMIVALLSVVLSLVLAPWFIQVSILVLILLWRSTLRDHEDVS
ncbi:MAG: hypothetical protein WBA76_21965 [Phormidesmis sp.]